MLRFGVVVLGLGMAMTLQPGLMAQESGGAARVAGDAMGTQGVEMVLPNQADPAVKQYLTASVVKLPEGGGVAAPLALFLPGTGGKPANVVRLLRVIAGQGYRVIGLTYDDEPSLSKVCPRRPDPACSARFREMRTFGRGQGPVENPPEEAINARLIALLRYLAREHPDGGWARYLTADGRPRWDRILVSGMSQGAGMAAFIAKAYPVYRVVLFSSPWDTTGKDRQPAPWLSRPSATPPERWWAERHAREKTTELIAHAYQALGIPPAQILLFNADLPVGMEEEKGAEGEGNPFHGSTIRNPAYLQDWKRMYGTVMEGAGESSK